MTPLRTFGRLALPAALALVAACGDGSPTEPTLPPESTLAFRHSGERAGSYRVVGEALLDAERRPRHGTWAAALQVPGDALAVSAARARTHPLADVFLLAVQNADRTGSYRVDARCGADPNERCAAGMLAIGYHWEDGRVAPEATYLLVSGTVSVTAVTAERIRGTFRGGAARTVVGAEVLQIEDGEFDVPITAAERLQRGAAMAAPPADLLRALLEGVPER
jgi:hypothetical protein